MSISTRHPAHLEPIVEPARGRADVRAFARLPRDLYRKDPNWLPPLVSERRAFPGRRPHPVLGTGEVELFLATRRGRPVGRVAAVRHRRRTGSHGVRQGFFAMFECVDDPAVARRLIDTAATWLRTRGCDTITGPVGLLPGQESGLLLGDAAGPPVALTPYNPPYYPALLESCGLTKVKDLWAWSAGAEPPERIQRVARAARLRESLTVRALDATDLDAECERLREIRRGDRIHDWGLAPVTERDFAHLFTGLRGLLPPGAALVCEAAGEPIAFAAALPDRNRALTGPAVRLARLGLPPTLLPVARATASAGRWRAVAFGVKEGFRSRGVEAVLVAELWRAARRLGCDSWEATWTLEDNHAMNRVMEVLGATRSRTYRLYSRPA
ncbi:GNAT family N-acetyltransferase [Thermopolyspora sp. NPDC052614]|uniref:GNAT family N-acetyltransferase n=1 Tax=Thermopolyspora sp. NPDC052614 TaxID=3155682 RepID=UPI00341AA274